MQAIDNTDTKSIQETDPEYSGIIDNALKSGKMGHPNDTQAANAENVRGSTAYTLLLFIFFLLKFLNGNSSLHFLIGFLVISIIGIGISVKVYNRNQSDPNYRIVLVAAFYILYLLILIYEPNPFFCAIIISIPPPSAGGTNSDESVSQPHSM